MLIKLKSGNYENMVSLEDIMYYINQEMGTETVDLLKILIKDDESTIKYLKGSLEDESRNHELEVEYYYNKLQEVMEELESIKTRLDSIIESKRIYKNKLVDISHDIKYLRNTIYQDL